MKSLKVLFFPLSVFISHVTRCLCVAEEMKSRGHSIEFVACSKYKTIIEETGFQVHDVAEINFNREVIFGAPKEYYKRFDPNLAKRKFGLEEMVRDDASVIKKVDPDLIVYDGRATALFPAFTYNVPCVEIRNLIGHLFKDERDYLIEQGETRDFHVNNDDEQSFVLELYKAIRNFKLDLEEFREKKYYPVPVIIPGISSFEIKNSINHFENRRNTFVGPLFWNGFNSHNINEIEIKGKTVILIATGSTFPFNEVIKTIFKAFPEEKYQIIANVGDNYDDFQESIIPQNCSVVKYIPLAEFLKHVNVVIYHAGHGTAMHVLNAGLPSVVIPFNGDHLEISQHIDNLKIGKCIRKYPDDILQDEIRETVLEVLENKEYKENVEKYQAQIQNSEKAEQKAADFIENYYNELLMNAQDKVV